MKHAVYVQVVLPDTSLLCLRLKTLEHQSWLHVSWHHTAARICVGSQPVRGHASEAFALVDQLSAHLRGLVLTDVEVPRAWERVALLRFATRAGGPPERRLYCEIMGRYTRTCCGAATNL